jgi:hypothetical protein
MVMDGINFLGFSEAPSVQPCQMATLKRSLNRCLNRLQWIEIGTTLNRL